MTALSTSKPGPSRSSAPSRQQSSPAPSCSSDCTPCGPRWRLCIRLRSHSSPPTSANPGLTTCPQPSPWSHTPHLWQSFRPHELPPAGPMGCPERSICAWSHAIACVGISLVPPLLAGGVAWLRWFISSSPSSSPQFRGPTLKPSLPIPSCAVLPATVQLLCLIGIPSVQGLRQPRPHRNRRHRHRRSLQRHPLLRRRRDLTLPRRTLPPAAHPRCLLLMAIGLTVTLLANIIRTGRTASAAAAYRCRLLLRTPPASSFSLPFHPPRPLSAPAKSSHQSWKIPTKSQASPQTQRRINHLVPHCGKLSVETCSIASTKPNGRAGATSRPCRAPTASSKSPAFPLSPPPQCATTPTPRQKGARRPRPHLYSIRWNPGNPAAEAAKVHRPSPERR